MRFPRLNRVLAKRHPLFRSTTAPNHHFTIIVQLSGGGNERHSSEGSYLNPTGLGRLARLGVNLATYGNLPRAGVMESARADAISRYNTH